MSHPSGWRETVLSRAPAAPFALFLGLALVDEGVSEYARLGYTYSYLAGKDSARALFMSLSLLAMYGLASYLLLSFVV